ncbi:MAG: PAS domain-containing protein [Deltaproteobacteria bacterium]|nr:PAS domain-containing protein [Deltaproteobacteria bacterium]
MKKKPAQSSESEAILQVILDLSPSLISVKSADGVCLLANRSCAELMGLTPEELVGKRVGSQLDAAMAEQILESDRQALESTTPITIEEDIKFPNGEVRTFISKKFPVFVGENEPLGICAVSTEITAQRKAEADREQFMQELKERNEELEVFNYTVSHDLKGPLVTISGFLGFLEQDISNNDVEKIKQDTELIAQAVENMAVLLEDMLKLSRVGKIQDTPVAVPMDELVTEALTRIHGRLDGSGVSLAIQPELPTIYCDRERLVEVFQNLIENAVKYMGDQQEPQINIGVREEGDRVIYFVRDNGVGIDPSYHKKVFSLFGRLDTTIEGTGVGLNIVQRIVSLHNGNVWVESEGVGKGSTFCFTICMAECVPGTASNS